MLTQLKAMYDRVETAAFADDSARPTVYFVEGFGLQTYVQEDDAAAIGSLLENRVQQLARMSLADLRSLAARLKVDDYATLPTTDLIFAINAREVEAEVDAAAP